MAKRKPKILDALRLAHAKIDDSTLLSAAGPHMVDHAKRIACFFALGRAIASAQYTSAGRNGGKKTAELTQASWHPHAEALALKCPSPRYKVDIAKFIERKAEGKSWLPSRRQLLRHIDRLIEEGKIPDPKK